MSHRRIGLAAIVCLFLLSGLTALAQAPPSMPPSGLPEAGDYLQEIEVGGVHRQYWVHLPPDFDFDSSRPLLVVVHGASNQGSEAVRQSGFNDLADREDLIVAYPEGLRLGGKLQSWNAGFCCGKAVEQKVDDVAFLDAVLREASGRLQVDRAKVFMIGESNGGMLTYRYAAEHTSVLAGIGVVNGTLGGRMKKQEEEWRIPQPKAPLPVVAIHGRKDKRVAYRGGKSRGGISVVSAQDSALFWVGNNLCAKRPKRQTLWGGKVELQTWLGCTLRSEVLLYTLDGWGHSWPGAQGGRALRNPKGEAFDAAEMMWKFFRTKRRWVKIQSGMRPTKTPATRKLEQAKPPKKKQEEASAPEEPSTPEEPPEGNR